MPSQTRERYLEKNTGSDLVIWNFTNKYKTIPKGKTLRVQCHASAKIRWTTDDWATYREMVTFDSGVGVHYADLGTAQLEYGQKINYTFFWTEPETWENKNYQLHIENAPFLNGPAEPDKGQPERDKIKIFLPS